MRNPSVQEICFCRLICRSSFQSLIPLVSQLTVLIKYVMLVLCSTVQELKLPIAGMGNCTSTQGLLSESSIELIDLDRFIGGIEFIAPDVLFKTSNDGVPTKHRDYTARCPSGWIGEGRAF